ncbi:MAG: ABC transporter substrate-binding protein [Sphaerochaeta sp.]
MKKITMMLVILLAVTTLVFAAGAKEAQKSDTVTLRWAYWGGEARIERSEAAIKIFEAQNPGVKVHQEPSGGAGDHFVKVDTQVAAGAGPDVINMGGNYPDYIPGGPKGHLTLDLFPYAEQGLINLDVIDPGAIAYATVDGALYGLSTGANMPALVINKSLIERVGAPLPPVTSSYAEFRQYLIDLQRRLPSGVYAMQDIGVLASNSTPFGYWTGYNGTPLYIAAEKATKVTAADAKRYLDLFADYRSLGVIPPADIAASYAETNADTSMLVAGKAAIGFLWTNQVDGYQQAMVDEIDLIEFPGAAERNALWQTQSQVYTINKDSPNKEWAAKFVDFLVNSPDAAAVLGTDRGNSVSSIARAVGVSNPNEQKGLDYMAVAGPHTMPENDHVPNDTEFNSTLFLIYQRVAFGQISTAQGGQEIVDLLNRMIEK